LSGECDARALRTCLETVGGNEYASVNEVLIEFAALGMSPASESFVALTIIMKRTGGFPFAQVDENSISRHRWR
jgi:hypothetical protein